MRIFTAIPWPTAAKDKFTEIARGRLPIPYVNTSNFHVTLNFFGELDSDEVIKITREWTNAIPVVPKFRIEFEALVKFRQQLHLVIKENAALAELQGKLEDHFMQMGFRFQERDFYAHVKIANLHMDNVMNRERKIENFPHEELARLSFEADRIGLYESKLLLHHPQHIELSVHELPSS